MSRPSSLPAFTRAVFVPAAITGWLAAATAAVAAPATTTAPEASASAATTPSASDGTTAAPKPAPRPRQDPDGTLPLRLGVFFGHAFGQSGDLTRNITGTGGMSFQLPSPSVIGVDVGTGLGRHVRYHFAVGLQWESQPNYAAKGFRIDLAGLGFPIAVWSNEKVAIHVESLLHLIRGEILF